MKKEERIELYEDAIKTWGTIAQFDQCVEEMAELIVAINKCKRKELFDESFAFNTNENLIEELADVSMCLEQLIYMVGEQKVSDMQDIKLGKMKGQLDKYKNSKKSC